MEEVVRSPLQQFQEWIGRSSQPRHPYEYVHKLKPAKASRCKYDEHGRFAISAEKRAALRALRMAHYKTAQQWKVKTPSEDAPVAQVAAAPTKAQDIGAEFLQLAETWDRETALLSSTPKMVLHHSYQRIMAMGPEVIPVLLRDLRDNRRSWFWALRHLTQANPVRPEDQGNLDKMVAAWVAWGKRERHI